MGQTLMQRVPAGAMRTNCYFIYDEISKETLIIDPADEAERLCSLITEQELKPVAILLTHGHFDHIGAVQKLRTKYRTQVYCLDKEQEILESDGKNLSSVFGYGFTVKPDKLLVDGQKLTLAGLSIEVMATPGHTQGSCCYYFPEDRFLISGDTLFEESYGRTDFPTGSESALVRSIREKLFALPEETPVYAGHGEPTTIGHEKRFNPVAG